MSSVTTIDTYHRLNKLLSEYDLIVFEGPPTAGKTMLAKRFSKTFSRKLILETTGRILSWFHQDRSARAFTTQIYFLTHRMTQAKEANKLIIDGEKVCQDYAFWKDMVYAQTFLNDKDYKIYCRLYQLLEPATPRPNLLVLLDCSPEVVMSRLRARKRKGESSLGIQEVAQISKATMSLASKEDCPKILIDTTEFGITASTKVRDQLFTLVVNEILELLGC